MKKPEDIEVKDRKTFVEFVETLRYDLDKNGSAWENITLDSFLGALSAYAGDIQGYYDNMNIPIDANLPSWRVFADILSGTSIYE